jgi:histone deacetylase complex regulatory component SIN3
VLFQGHPELLEGFQQFMPLSSASPPDISPAPPDIENAPSPDADSVQFTRNGGGKAMKVADALRYLDDVKAQLAQQEYVCFLQLMRDFQDQR